MNVVQKTSAGILLLILSPILIVTYCAIFINMGRPVFFIQERTGLQGRTFRIIKFRTMRSDGVEDADRLTKFGRLLRRFSLDELPQLWNVMKGDMSFVGPRPLLPEYLPLYSKRQARRHEVRPGVTGWAQVNGRNAISWEQKFDFDVWYVENRSFLLDLRILYMTAKKVTLRDGISSTNEATMSLFTGSSSEPTE